MKTNLILGGLLALTSVSNAQWALNGNAIVGTNFMGSTNGVDVRFSANNTERFRIRSSNGFIGINTTSPGARLEVNGTSASDDGIRISQTSTGKCALFLANSNGSGRNWALLSDNSGDLSIDDYGNATRF